MGFVCLRVNRGKSGVRRTRFGKNCVEMRWSLFKWLSVLAQYQEQFVLVCVSMLGVWVWVVWFVYIAV